MKYQLLIRKHATRALSKLPVIDYTRISDAIHGLSDDPRPPGSMKLSGREGWRIRVGSYRILYDIDDDSKTVIVLDIVHRRDIYRRM